MKTYIYVFKNKEGQVLKRKVKAQNIQSATLFLKKKGIAPISLKVEGKTLSDFFKQEQKVKDDDIVAFSQLFGGCIESGLTIKESLELLSKQIKSKILRDKIGTIIIDIESGTSISDSFKKHTDVFPIFYPMLLKAGEASGDLAEVLEYIANYLDQTNNLKKQIVATITYPLIVSVVGIGLLYVVLVFVAPTFKDVFTASGKELPIPTKLLFFFSDIATQFYELILFIMLAIIVGLYTASKTIKGKKYLDRIVLFLPISGEIARQVIMLRFLGAFDILINNKVPMTESLQVLEEATVNLVLKKIVTDIRKDVARGLPLAGPLIANKSIVSPIVSYTISMGEKSGNLPKSLKRLSGFMDKSLSYSMKKLSSKIDPLLTAFLGFIVLFVAMAIYLPVFKMMDI